VTEQELGNRDVRLGETILGVGAGTGRLVGVISDNYCSDEVRAGVYTSVK
jgi:hypothetical protein